MRVRASVEGLGVKAIVATGGLAKDVLVSITGNNTVDQAGADDFVIGRLSVPAKDDDGSGTVETRFKELWEMTASGAVDAGEWVVAGAANAAVAFDDQTDDPLSIIGICWKGGTNGQTIEVLAF